MIARHEEEAPSRAERLAARPPASHRRGLWLLLGPLVLLSCSGLPAEASCGPTLTSINVDGRLDDWTTVLTNEVNTSWDAWADCRVGGDRDCADLVEDRTDLRRFAYTWDEQFLHVMIERGDFLDQDSYFYLYLDSDDLQSHDGAPGGPDGLGDRRVRFILDEDGGRWRLRVRVQRLDQPAAMRSMLDPLASDCGITRDLPCGDGHELGADGDAYVDEFVHPDCDTGCATIDGLAFEYSIPWAELAMGPGEPLSYHLATARDDTDNPAEFHDAMAGTLGGPGSTAFTCLELDAGRTVMASAGALVDLPHVLTQLGNADGFVPVGLSSARGWPLELWTDPDGDGDPGDGVRVARDGNGDGDLADATDVPPEAVWDPDADGRPDAALVGGPGFAPGESLPFVVRVEVPLEDCGADSDLVTSWAGGEDGVPLVMVRDRIVLGELAIDAGRDRVVVRDSALAGCLEQTPDAVAHPFRLYDGTGAGAVATLSAFSSLGWATRFGDDPDCDGDPIDSTPLAGSVALPPGGAACLFVFVEVPIGATAGARDVTGVDATTPTASVTAGFDTLAAWALRIGPDRNAGGAPVTKATPFTLGWQAQVLENACEAPEAVRLSHTSLLALPGRLFTDPDGDGIPADGVELPGGGLTPPVPGRGVDFPVLLGLDLSAAMAGQRDRSDLFALLDSNPTVFDQSVVEMQIENAAPFRDPTFSVQATHQSPCDPLIFRGVNQSKSQAERHRVELFDPTGTRVEHLIKTAGDDETLDHWYWLPPDVPLGDWTFNVFQCSNSYLADLTCGMVEIPNGSTSVRVEAAGSLTELAVAEAQRGLLAGTVSARFAVLNENERSWIEDSVVELLVLDPGGSWYLATDGNFRPLAGGRFTSELGVPALRPGESFAQALTWRSVQHIAAGAGHQVQATWRLPCGRVLAQGVVTYEVVPTETSCCDGVDDDGDGLVDCGDSDCAGSEDCLGVELCTNGADDDGDGLVDCDDPDCAADPACLPPEDCANGIDDDGDGAVDCDDADCAADPACLPPEDCANGVDDDGDGDVDCEDADCAADPACAGGPALAINRSIALTPPGTTPTVDSAFCAGPRWRVCEEQLVPGPLDGMVLSGEALPSGRSSLHFYEHSDAVSNMHVGRTGADLVLTLR